MWRALMQLEVEARGASSVTEADLADHAAFALPPPAPAAPLAGEARAALIASVLQRGGMDWQDASVILPHVWVGNAPAALNEGWLRANGIGVVVNCAAKGEIMPMPAAARAASGVRAFHSLDITESVAIDPLPALLRGADLVAEAVAAGTPVLVHCLVGMNRSVSTALVYLMKYHGLDLLTALHFVKGKRPIAFPNREMFPRLLVAERRLRPDAAASLTLADLTAHGWAPLPHWPLPPELAASGGAGAAAAGAAGGLRADRGSGGAAACAAGTGMEVDG
jgi:hypothetical protein